MLGKDVPYVHGWDCHGLPIEWKVEEKYRKEGKDKDQVPLIEFRKECRDFANHWLNIQRGEFKRLGGTGDWENPYTTLQQASAAAKKEYDIVFVHVGNSVASPYDTSSIGGYQFQEKNQYLVGEGTTLQLCTANCGQVPLWGTGDPGKYPVITNPTGAAIVVEKNGTVVDHLQISGARVGISDCDGMELGPVVLCDGMPTQTGGTAYINDVRIYGNGPGQTGVIIKDLTGNNGTFNFTNMDLRDLTANARVKDRSLTDFARMVEVFDLAASQPQVVSQWRRLLGAALNVR
jgi:hypothetical protein